MKNSEEEVEKIAEEILEIRFRNSKTKRKNEDSWFGLIRELWPLILFIIFIYGFVIMIKLI